MTALGRIREEMESLRDQVDPYRASSQALAARPHAVIYVGQHVPSE